MAEFTKGERCSARVYPTDRWGAFHPYQCNKKSVVVRDGKLYCKVHDPEYIKAKQDKLYQEHIQHSDKKAKERTLANLAVSACQQVNPDNPQAVAEAIPKLYEALKEFDTAYKSGSKVVMARDV